jgi:hypothetical protein
LGAVTYPEQTVADTIATYFVGVQIPTQEPAATPIIERYRQVWTPDLRVLGPDGFEYYSWNGYLPPFEFVPHLLIGEAQARLRTHDEAGAAELYAQVVQRFPTSQAAAQAQYFFSVAKYKASHEANDLLGGWRQLRLRYPSSIWRIKQSFIE